MSGKIKAQADSLAPQALFVGQEGKDMEETGLRAEEESEREKIIQESQGVGRPSLISAGH